MKSRTWRERQRRCICGIICWCQEFQYTNSDPMVVTVFDSLSGEERSGAVLSISITVEQAVDSFTVVPVANQDSWSCSLHAVQTAAHILSFTNQSGFVRSSSIEAEYRLREVNVVFLSLNVGLFNQNKLMLRSSCCMLDTNPSILVAFCHHKNEKLCRRRAQRPD